jgi:hypothetical protein
MTRDAAQRRIRTFYGAVKIKLTKHGGYVFTPEKSAEAKRIDCAELLRRVGMLVKIAP